MAAYIIRRILFMIPTIFGIMLVSFVVVQFAPGRPGRARHRPAPRHRYRRHLAHFRLGRRRFCARRHAKRLAIRRQLQIPRRPGARPGIHQEPGKAVRLRQAGLRALLPDDVELSAFRLRQELFPRRQRAPADQGEAPGIDLARHLDDAAELPDLDSARHPQGGARRLAVRRLDLRRHHRRLCHSRLPVRDSAYRPVRRRLVLANLPVARAHLGRLVAISLVGKNSRLLLAPRRCRSSPWGLPPSPP